MSTDPQGPLSAIAGPIADTLKQHQSAPPAIKASNKGHLGAFLISGCGALALTDDFAGYPNDWKLGIAAVAGFGLLLLVSAWRTRSARNLVGAFFAVTVPLAGFIAVLNWMPELLDYEYARCFAVAVVGANTVRFWLAVRGPGDGPQRIVHRQIADNSINWKAVTRRR